MELKTAKILGATAAIAGLLILLPVLWRSLGLSKTFFLIAGLASAVVLIILLWLSAHYITVHQRRARQSVEHIQSEYSFLRRVTGLPSKFPYSVLEAATDNFGSLIGRGSSGSVFKGILDDGTPVAVKMIPGGLEHGDSEFRSEISTVAAAQHLNLIRLLGYCLLPGGPRFLIYEYIANGSLASWIFPGNGGKCLPWGLRYRAAVDVARALAYLHNDCRVKVLHLDVKPENILLTESFRAVVSDFGLSKLISRDESKVVTTGVRGTRGYLAPEWLLDRGVSEKCDVYSYGMVLFELVGGRRNVQAEEGDGQRWSYLPRIMAAGLREGRVMEVVDERIVEGVGDVKEVLKLVQVALWCVQEEAGVRPSMAKVVDMLEGRIGVEQPPETEMVIVDVLDIGYDNVGVNGGGGGGGGASSSLVFRSEEMTGSSRSLATTVLSGR